MSNEAPQHEPEGNNPQIEYIDELIFSYDRERNSDMIWSIPNLAGGALAGFIALTDSLQNGSMRGGEIVYATISATTIYIGSMLCRDYRTKSKTVDELALLRARALGSQQGN